MANSKPRGPVEATVIDPAIADATVTQTAAGSVAIVETDPVDTAAIGLKTGEPVRDDTVHVGSLAAAAAVLDGKSIGIEQPGPGAGALRLADKAEGFETRPIADNLDPLRRNRERLDAAMAGRREILPRAGVAIDPATVPGKRVATAATQVRRDDRTYQPGEPVPVDYRAHAELTTIGAIVAAAWRDLPWHDDD